MHEDSPKNLKKSGIEMEKTFGQKMFYTIGLLGAVTSLIGFIFVLIMHTDWKVLYIATTGFVYSMAIISILVYLLSERKKLTQERYEAVQEAVQASFLRTGYKSLHSISHAFRDELYKLERLKTPLPIDKIKDAGFLVKVLDNTKNIFEKATQNTTCSTCIKLCVPNTKDIITLARDTSSIAESELADYYRKSTVESNTASQRIINDRDAYFFCNNLQELESKGNYRNDRNNWQEKYLSTIVLPIRCFDNNKRKHHIPALLCVDSMKPGIFDEDVCVQIGACITDMLFPYFCHRNINWTPQTGTRSRICDIPSGAPKTDDVKGVEGTKGTTGR